MELGRKQILIGGIGGALTGGCLLTAALSGSDDALLWVVRVLLGLMVLRFALVGFVLIRFRNDSPQIQPRQALARGATSLAQAVAVAIVLLSDFSSLGIWVGTGLTVSALAADIVSDRCTGPT